MNRFFSFLLFAFSASLLSAQEPVPSSSSASTIAENNIIASGNCGDNITWTIDNEGELHLSGSGPMYDYYFLIIPSSYHDVFIAPDWVGFDFLKTLVIDEGITTVGREAFETLSNLSSISLPNTLESIGDYAFEGCPIEEIVIPESVKSVGKEAFYNTNIEEIFIPKTVEKWSGAEFMLCRNLKRVFIEEGVEKTSGAMFKMCNSLIEVSLPVSLKTIDGETFMDCTSLQTIDIPKQVEEIAVSSFTGCSELVSVNVHPDNAVYTSTDGVVYDKTGQALYIFPGGKTEYYLPAEVIFVESMTFSSCKKLQSIEVDPDNEFFASKDGLLYSKDMKFVFACPATKSLVLLPDGVEVVGDYAFYGCELKEMMLPETVRTLGVLAFAYCTYLEKVKLPDTLEVIPYMCFFWNFSLREINIPTSIKRIENEAFSYARLEELNLPEGLEYISGGAFDCAVGQISSIVIPSTCTYVGNWAFNQAHNVQSITCKAAVPPTIFEKTFNSCGDGFLGYECSVPVYVPYASIDDYRTAPYWQDMNLQVDPTDIKNIVADDNTDVESHIFGLDGTRTSMRQKSFFVTKKTGAPGKVGYIQ